MYFYLWHNWMISTLMEGFSCHESDVVLSCLLNWGLEICGYHAPKFLIVILSFISVCFIYIILICLKMVRVCWRLQLSQVSCPANLLMHLLLFFSPPKEMVNSLSLLFINNLFPCARNLIYTWLNTLCRCPCWQLLFIPPSNKRPHNNRTFTWNWDLPWI